MPKVRAFVAEDDALILLSLEMMLEASDVEIVGSAGSVGEAEEIAASITADIAILDVNLNNKMVFPAADVFVARGIPVIFTTGYTSAQGVPDRFVGTPRATKPYKAEVLIDLIRKAIGTA
ncbi:response regulator [Methylocystis sp.]|uniref:response regulator n=1 Tax=Methylocystis sp. TaxID=1911079 RepID=UPI003DA541CB